MAPEKTPNAFFALMHLPVALPQRGKHREGLYTRGTWKGLWQSYLLAGAMTTATALSLVPTPMALRRVAPMGLTPSPHLKASFQNHPIGV